MQGVENFIDALFARHRWVVHVGFWLFVLFFYVIFFGRASSNYLQTLFFVGLLMPVTIGTTYFLNYYLVPRYLMNGRYWFFLLYFFYTLLGTLFLEMSVAMLTFIIMAKVKIQDMSPASFDWIFLLTSLLMVVFFGVAIKMLLHWRKSKEEYEKLMREKVETELKFLKTQLHPHFLFNTLNNLYFLSTQKSDRAPEAILQLSEILDYVMRSGKTMFVPLTHEWKQVENYIALELLRYKDRVVVTTSFTGETDNHEIGPMILITLIENAFKHGVMSTTNKSWINLNVQCGLHTNSISISNSSTKGVEKKGMGLENLRGQLDLLYSDGYSMNVNGGDHEFSVNLILRK